MTQSNIKNKLSLIISHPVVSGSALLIVGSMTINVINLVYHFIMGRLLTEIDYGTLLSLYSILYILSIVPISSSVSIVKFISSAKTSKDRAGVYEGVKSFVFKIASIGSLGVILFSPLIAKFLNINDTFSVVLTAGVLFFSLTTLVNQASMQGILEFMGVVAPNFVSSLIKLLLGVVLIYLGLSVRGVMAAVVIGVALAYLLSLKLVKGKFANNTKEKFKLKPFLKYSWPVLIQALAFTSFFTTDVILVKHFLPPYEAGLYAALSTLGKIVYFAASPVAQVMFPHVSGRHAKGEEYIHTFLVSVILTGIVSFGIVGVYYLFPSVVLQVLYPKFIAAKDNLVWMGLFIAFYTIANLLVNFLLSINKLKIVFLPLVFAVFQIVLIWFYHKSLLQVIQISLFEMIIMSFILFVYLGYNEVWKKRKPSFQ